jgi:hypothetical protein
MKLCKKIIFSWVSVVFISFSCLALADSDLEEMQKRLNGEVLSKQFSVPDEATLTKSNNEATERGKPSKSKTQDGYYRYFYNGYYYPNRYFYNGFYYPHPYSYYRQYGYWY